MLNFKVVFLMALFFFQQAYGYGPYSGTYPPGTQVVYAANGQAYAVPYQYPYAGNSCQPLFLISLHLVGVSVKPVFLFLSLRISELCFLVIEHRSLCCYALRKKHIYFHTAFSKLGYALFLKLHCHIQIWSQEENLYLLGFTYIKGATKLRGLF